ncbi:Zn(II)2Cys6 transcription factor, partial [Aspergillus aculeatinus CBS 121060]
MISMIGPARRRRRPAVSCSLCRRRKIKCDRQAPCSHCTRSGNQATCEYDNSDVSRPSQPALGVTPTRPAPYAIPTEGSSHNGHTAPDTIPNGGTSHTSRTESSVPSLHSAAHTTASTEASTVASPQSDPNVEALRDRVRQLEQRLAETVAKPAVQPPPVAPIPEVVTAGSTMTGLFHLQHDKDAASSAVAITRSIMHKSRLFGQSFWINGMATEFWSLFQILETHARDQGSQAFTKIQKCKAIGKIIKDRRTPSWPVVTATPLPRREVADQLVDCYLRTSEAIHRILHIPTFRRDYDALWAAPSTPDPAFVIQLKLVLAIGAATYDEHFTLRPSAMAWVYEALTWLAKPEYKAHLSMQFLQLNLLVLLAREATGIGGTLTWIPAGSLLRMAMHIGLHRDPNHLPKRTLFASEMRRRLWNTVLELSVASSMLCGGPPLLSLEDFDTLPPSNYDDDQLTNTATTASNDTDTANPPAPQPDNTFTQTSIAIAYRKTFPARLAITQALNNLNTKLTYEDTLRLDADLRTAYQETCHTLHTLTTNQPLTRTPSPFTLHLLDFQINHHFIALHIPYFIPALHDPRTYAYTRKVLTETALRIWCTAWPSSAIIHPVTATTNPPSPSPSLTHTHTHTHAHTPKPPTPTPNPDSELLSRYITNTSSPYTQTTMQAYNLAAFELRAQLREACSAAPASFAAAAGPLSHGYPHQPIRHDLLTITREAKPWLRRGLRSGETNMKGYLLQALVEAQVEAVLRRVPDAELGGWLVRAAERAVEEALGVL